MDIETEKELVLKAQQTPESFGELYDYYFPKVYRYTAAKVNNQRDAEDLVSSIFIKVLEHLPSYKWKGFPFGAWIFRIAKNAIIDYYRSAYKSKNANIDDLPFIRDKTDLGAPDKKTAKNELGEIVKKVLEGLNEVETEVIRLKFFSELSNKEIAEILNLTQTNVGVILFRTLRKIKPDLEPAKVMIHI